MICRSGWRASPRKRRRSAGLNQSLTGISNRESFRQRCRTVFAAANRFSSDLAGAIARPCGMVNGDWLVKPSLLANHIIQVLSRYAPR